MSTSYEYDADGRLRSITTRTYAVPTRHGGTALNMVCNRVTKQLPMGTRVNARVVGTESVDPDTGKPEVLVEVRGDERAHSGMLGHFVWCGW